METLHLSAEKQGDIEKAAQILRQGGLVGIPTETVYGLAADALNGPAVAGIFAAKNRPMDNPLIVHISDLSQWEDLVDGVPENARALAAAYWPGPMTIILPKSEKIPDEVSAPIRWPGRLSGRAVAPWRHPPATLAVVPARQPRPVWRRIWMGESTRLWMAAPVVWGWNPRW